MIRYSKALFALAIAAGSVASVVAQDYAPGRVLVKFRGNSLIAAYNARTANRAIGATEEGVLRNIDTRSIRVPRGMSPNDAVAYYKRLGTVVYAELDYKREPTYIPNDPRLGQQYGPTITKCPQAWDLTKGSGTVVIAIIDTGIEASHEDFAGKLVPGFDFSDNDADPDWTSSGSDHGVHVAGIAAAATDNAKGGVGTGFNCKIMPLKIFPNSFASVSAAAIMHAADNGAKVVNMSYGGGFASQTELDAVNYAWGKGVVLLAASGNDGSMNNDLYPAKFPNCIAVGATNAQDLVAGFTQGNDSWVDVLAPGDNIMSTTGGNTYNAYSGTSMASPMAAGIVGLLWAMAAPGTTAAQVRQALESTTDPISNNNGKSKFGRVNAFEAVKMIDPGSATISPPVGIGGWFGQAPIGGASDLLNSDGSFVTVGSGANALGQVGGISIDVDFQGVAFPLREAIAWVEANGPTGSTGQLFLYNDVTGSYTLIKAFALRPTGVKRERINLPLNLTPYVNGSSVLTAGVRAIGPNRPPRNWRTGAFDFKVGFFQVTTREQS